MAVLARANFSTTAASAAQENRRYTLILGGGGSLSRRRFPAWKWTNNPTKPAEVAAAASRNINWPAHRDSMVIMITIANNVSRTPEPSTTMDQWTCRREAIGDSRFDGSPLPG